MDTISKGEAYVMNTYGRFPIAAERGEGCYLWDEDGKRYLDFVAGIAVNSLGHGHKKLAAAISAQAASLIHCSNLYWTRPQVALAVKLVQNSSFKRVFFCNSGAEAVEAAIKLSRKFGSDKGKFELITMANSFHGRTMGAVTATGQLKYQKGFAPLLPGVRYADFNDFESVRAALTPETAAILIEPIQGEGGIRPADPDFLKAVRELCDANDILLIFDEIQCGVGRTGKLFAHELFGVYPDAVCLAKGLAGGVPIGALLVSEKCESVLGPGEHASTFGGNPLAAAAANVVLDELLPRVLENAAKAGEYLTAGLRKLQERRAEIVDVRGVGLMQGIELSVPASDIIKRAIANGLLLVGSGANVIRFVPPLIVTEKEIDEMLEILERSL